RYGSCLEFIAALEQALEPKGPSRPLGGWVPPGYRLNRSLGSSQLGEVWEATDPYGRPVALRVIRNLEYAEAKQRLMGFELAKGLPHPHLIQLHEYWLFHIFGELISEEGPVLLPGTIRITLVIAPELGEGSLGDRLEKRWFQPRQGLRALELLP